MIILGIVLLINRYLCHSSLTVDFLCTIIRYTSSNIKLKDPKLNSKGLLF